MMQTMIPNMTQTEWDTLTGNGEGSLSRILDFGHVIYVNGYGKVTDNPVKHPYIEEGIPVDNADSYLGEWELITGGLTNQYGYRGAWLHDSELIEGGVARRILEHANRVGGGFYVAVYGEYQDADYGNETVIEGWSIAYQGKAI